MGCRMQHFNFFVFLILFRAIQLEAAEITSIDFKGVGGPSEITIQSDGPLQFEKQENQPDKQIVLEFKGATISKSNSRKIDTSSFNSKISLISPYQVDGQDQTVRIVIQERDYSPATIRQDGNVLKVLVSSDEENTSGNNSQAASLAAADASSSATTAKSGLDQFVENQGTGSFSGKKITLQLRDVDLSDVFRLIGESSGFNIIVGDDVKGKVTLSLVDVPWDQALDVVLHSGHLGAERNNNILRIATLSGLTQEKVDEFNAKKAAQANTPQVTKVFAINYANLNELQQTLIKFGSQSTASVGGSGSAGVGAPMMNPAVVQLDNRTNSIVVRDYPDNIERMKKLIEILDTQTPEVMIEAKIVEASESFSNSINGGLGMGGLGSTSFYGAFNGGNPLDGLISSTNTGSTIASGTSGAGSFGFSPDVTFIPGVQALNAIIKLAEVESQAKVITAPKTVVLNKQKATIVEGIPVLVPVPATTVPGGTTTSGFAVQLANISLAVTPSVANDGSVLLNLVVERDVPTLLGNGQSGIGTRNLSTQVLVDSGSTLVIGGIYTQQVSHSGSGFPFLRKIPIIGALFGASDDKTDRNELFIFVTPRIINQKEAGLSS